MNEMFCLTPTVTRKMLKKRTSDQAGLDAHESALPAEKNPRAESPPHVITRRGVASCGRNARMPLSFEASLSDSTASFDATDLSVMKLGPLTGLHASNNGGVCELFANFIVGSVAHACEHADGSLTTEFFVRRECIFASSVPRRTKFKPVQTTNCFSDVVDRRPLALIWTDRESGLITRVTEFPAIKRMLIELYTRLLVNSEIFHALLNILKVGYDLAITGDTDAVSLETDTMEPELWRCINWESIVAHELNTRIDLF